MTGVTRGDGTEGGLEGKGKGGEIQRRTRRSSKGPHGLKRYIDLR